MVVSVTTGSAASSGSSFAARSAASRTESSAWSASKPGSNSSITAPWPSRAVPSILRSPVSDANSVSIGSTSSRSASCGAMPSSVVKTWTSGIGISGELSLGIAM